MRVLTDADFDRLPLQVILDAVRQQIAADARGDAIAPPRHTVSFPAGDLVFTLGGDAGTAGFRAYETFPKLPGAPEDQLTAAWDTATGRLLGIAIGERLGALRTGCLGGVAIDAMAPRQTRKLAVIGTGLQAETQVLAAVLVRDLAEISVFSRDPGRCAAFAARLTEKLGRAVTAAPDARLAVQDADVVVLATTSGTPVVEADWLHPTVHLNTVGPKKASSHELPPALADRASLIATDSPRQIAAMGADHMLHGHAAHGRIAHLGNLIGTPTDERLSPTLFLSAGLAGTEVVALAAALNYLSPA